MATLNRVLIGIITVLAIAAVALSFLLFQRRNEFRDRATILSEAIVKVVQNLDQQSGTKVSSKVTFTAPDPVAGIPETGSLSWEKFMEDKATEYANVRKTLSEATELSEDVIARRDELAKSLAEVGFQLQMPVEELSVSDLQNLADKRTYQEAVDKVNRLAKAAQQRSEDMIRAVTNAGNIMGASIDDREFRSRTEDIDENGRTIRGDFRHSDELEEFIRAVTDLNTRCNDYAKAIADGINRVPAFNWETNPDIVSDKIDYNRALTSLINDFEEINSKIVEVEQLKLSLEKALRERDEALENVAAVTKSRDKLQNEVTELKLQVKNLQKKTGDSGTSVVTDGDWQPDPNLEGRIIMVNDEWRFVILDLGKKDIRENVKLLVARDGTFVARLLVTKVTPTIAVAEILPELATAEVLVDDRVILPKQM